MFLLTPSDNKFNSKLEPNQTMLSYHDVESLFRFKDLPIPLLYYRFDSTMYYGTYASKNICKNYNEHSTLPSTVSVIVFI